MVMPWLSQGDGCGTHRGAADADEMEVLGGAHARRHRRMQGIGEQRPAGAIAMLED